MVTKIVNAGAPKFWHSFEAARIFPLAYQEYWREHDFDRWITLRPETGSLINSVQNDLLLRTDIHSLFSTYNFSVNPDVLRKSMPHSFFSSIPNLFCDFRTAIKIICFAPDSTRIAGTFLDRILLMTNDGQPTSF